MPITLAQAAQNTQSDYDPFIIDEFRKDNPVLDTMIFDQAVNPAGGGATLTYGYRRKISQSGTSFRAINTEYAPSEATTQAFTTELKVLGGSFQIDRVLANLGPAASGEIAFQMSDKIQSAQKTFADAVINGDSAANADSFDGLDVALTGSSTEFDATTLGSATAADWTALDDTAAQHAILDLIDEWLSALDGAPTVILGNRRAIARVRAVARRASMYTISPMIGVAEHENDGNAIGRTERYGNIALVDPGQKPGTNEDIIPVAADGTTDLFAYRVGLDGFHGIATVGSQLVQSWLPDFSRAGAVKTGEVELGPVGVALKKTKAATVLRDVKVSA
ncbi:major capsid protein [Brachybacterium massiliense]|uniref:major capsid protein n=1 Tax=Brachybacterium massiliense TaxID=1755098 RepID=UPI000B3BBAD5|nr:phage capsid protein [Brachybacterium massiliense]